MKEEILYLPIEQTVYLIFPYIERKASIYKMKI
jgi:hypothetical protein